MKLLGCITLFGLFIFHTIVPRVILFGSYIANNASGAAAFGHINMFVNFLWWFILPWTQISFWYLFPIGGWDWVALGIVAIVEIAFLAVMKLVNEV